MYLDIRNKKIAGVCGGLANYLGWSRLWVRVAALTGLFIIPQFVLLAYAVGYLVMEDRTNRSHFQ